MPRHHVVMLALLASASASSTVHAEPAPPTTPEKSDAASTTPAPGTSNGDSAARERAKTFFERGIEHYRHARYLEALADFRAALDVYDSPVFIFNVARTCDRLGDVPCALRHYRSYQHRSPQAPDLAEIVPRIQALEAELARQGIQQVTVHSKPSGAALELDGLTRGETPWTGELAPGVHRAKLTVNGHDELSVDLEVPAASASDVTLVMRPRSVALPPIVPPIGATPPPVKSEPEANRGGALGVWTYTAFGASAAALGGALVFELLSRARQDDVRTLAVQRERVAVYDEMRDHQTRARVLVGVGAGLAVVGTTLLVLDLRRAARRPSQVAVWATPQGTGLAWQRIW